jgi:hypothetical protein
VPEPERLAARLERAHERRDGMSIAQIKGRVLLDTFESIRARIGDAQLQALVSTLEGPVRQVLQGKISVGEWYPLEVMTSLMTAGVRELDGGDESVIVARSEAVIERELRGVYRIFVRLGSPESIIKRITAIHETYFKEVQISQRFLDQRKAVVRYTGFGPEHRVIEPAIIGFYRKALEISGAKTIEARFTTPISAGSGFSELQITWS